MSFGFSVGDFITVLQLANKIWKEISITKICVTYLSSSAFERGFCPTYEEFEARLRSYVLYDHAAQN
jgi:NH3-dependent NAD+ synthetase